MSDTISYGDRGIKTNSSVASSTPIPPYPRPPTREGGREGGTRPDQNRNKMHSKTPVQQCGVTTWSVIIICHNYLTLQYGEMLQLALIAQLPRRQTWWRHKLAKHHQTNTTYINAIENVQSLFSRRIPSLSKLSYLERLAILNLQPLEYRRLVADLVYYYKIINNYSSIQKYDFFIPYATSSLPILEQQPRPLPSHSPELPRMLTISSFDTSPSGTPFPPTLLTLRL